MLPGGRVTAPPRAETGCPAPLRLQVWAELQPYIKEEGGGYAQGEGSQAPGRPEPPEALPQQEGQQQQEQEREREQPAEGDAPAAAAAAAPAAEGAQQEAGSQGPLQPLPQQPQPKQQPAGSESGGEGEEKERKPRFLDTTLAARFCAAFATHSLAQRAEELQLLRALIAQGELEAAAATMAFYGGLAG